MPWGCEDESLGGARGEWRGLHLGSCPRLAGGHIGSRWDGLPGGDGQDLVRLGKLGWQALQGLSSLQVGDAEMGRLRRLSFMKLVPLTVIRGRGEREEGWEFIFVKAPCWALHILSFNSLDNPAKEATLSSFYK